MRGWLVASLAAVLAVSGCGGGARLSKQEFVAKAEAICRATHRREAAVRFPGEAPATGSRTELDRFADAIARTTEIDRAEVASLRKLRPPEDFQRAFDAMLKETGVALDHADEAVKAARKGDRAAMMRALSSAQPGAGPANARAEAYGLTTCAAL